MLNSMAERVSLFCDGPDSSPGLNVGGQVS